jgi:hypothetical protein
MPYQWIDPELFLEHNGVAVYHCYEDDGPVSYYWYTTDPSDDNRVWSKPETAQFDVRTLPDLGLDVNDFENHATIIQQAIQVGLIIGDLVVTDAPSPPTVKIEVRGGVAHVVEQSPGVTVEIVDLDENDGQSKPETLVQVTPENGQTGFLTLTRLANRLSYIITDLNGLISAVVNDEVTPADLAGKFGALVLKLDLLETAVHELEDLFWR